MPSFFVLRSANAGIASTPTVIDAASVQAPASATPPKPMSNYKDVGGASPSLPVTVSVVIPLRNLATLDSLVKQVSDPNSPNFRHFLNYNETSQMFLPTQSQYQSVLNYLTAHGFSIESTALNSMIVAHGTAAEVSQYLGQNVQIYSNGTYSYYQTTGGTSLSGAFSYGSNSSGLLIRPNFARAASVASGAIPSANVTFTEGGQSTTLLRTVYNSSSLLSKGFNGTGFTVGLLDFYGSTSVAADLALYDSTYGLPAPPSFSVSPIGPYNPNLGSQTGWDGEIDLDVQVSHAMAPSADIILYAANGGLSLAAAVAAIVQDGKANVVSQSFGTPEWEYYEAGPLPFLFNSVFTDDYYALGSAMGMTFLSSSGDAGGSGYSSGPEGGVEYPGSSPFVTTLGGTTTYISNSKGSLTINQTAWSNVGFVPYFVNLGGSGGGVSILEPTPWYQSSLPVPATYPSGRLIPDLSLDSSGTPGTYIIFHGAPLATGGTSEASPLFAGLLTLVMGSTKGSLGLVNPALYQMAGNPKTYQTAFTPITFGYTIPWVSKFGYNLATGWGAPNIGEIATLYASAATSSSSLEVNVGIVNPGKTNVTDFLPGEPINVVVAVTTSTGSAVTSGTFSAALQTLQGTAPSVSLTYSAAQHGWTGDIQVGNQSGIAYVNVAGTSGNANGSGFSSTFVGYLANYVSPLAPFPWTTFGGLEAAASITDLFGKTPTFLTTQVAIDTYSILSNTYKQVAVSRLNFSSGTGYYIGILNTTIPDGVTVFRMQGSVIGYLPVISGISFAGTDIYPQLVAEPGTIAPGQSLTIVAKLTGPENVDGTLSLSSGDTLGNTISYGSNVTATLVSPSGQRLETAALSNQVCAQALKVCGAALKLINGYMTVPLTASPGLYTILLNAQYNDETTGFNYTGSFFGQIYVASGASVPKVSVTPGTLYEGQNAQITANITYPNGKEVTNGLYTAFFYPKTAEDQYSSLMHSTYASFALTQLAYSPKLNLWVANATMPSPYNSSLVSSIDGNSGYYGGPYDVYVSGVSADGIPTTSVLSAQRDFFVQPYVYTADKTMSNMQQTSQLALTNVTINAGSSSTLAFTDDQFVGANSIQGGSVTISSSVINGTLKLRGSQTTLDGVNGGNIVLGAGHLNLLHSDISSLQVADGATVSVDGASVFQSVSPPIPVLSLSSPVANQSYVGSAPIQALVAGTGISNLTFTLDGKSISPPQGVGTSGAISFTLDTTSVPDGTHTLSMVATQGDGLSSSANVSFITQNQLAMANANLKATNDSLKATNDTLNAANANIATLQTQVTSANRSINDLTNAVYLALVVALVGCVMAAYLVRKSRAQWKF
ncbi:MAG: protease pro-enzyme activation domain-containing protein [Thaumarchaeota archaeon]|nr:protease pro-enzyme activation domain-containing protein [Nitrososphaerota archaeon]